MRLKLAIACALGFSAPAGAAAACANNEGAVAAITFRGANLQAGARVRVERTMAGRFAAHLSGHASSVAIEPGHTGTFLAGIPRQPSRHFTPPPNEPIQLACVRWDEQSWFDEDGARVTLPAFEAAIHAEYLTPRR